MILFDSNSCNQSANSAKYSRFDTSLTTYSTNEGFFVIFGEKIYSENKHKKPKETIKIHFEKEKTFRSHLQNARFVKGKHEYFPIPQSVIDICGAEVMKQNPGY